MTDVHGLVKLFLLGGLPPNVNVLRVSVHEDWEGKLVLDQNDISVHPMAEVGPVMGFRKEDITLEEIEVEGRKVLCGFSDLTYTLIVGQVE
jgi:hypothetical protein